LRLHAALLSVERSESERIGNSLEPFGTFEVNVGHTRLIYEQVLVGFGKARKVEVLEFPEEGRGLQAVIQCGHFKIERDADSIDMGRPNDHSLSMGS
jgi:hypothetical protein